MIPLLDGKQTISPLSNPFQAECVETINIEIKPKAKGRYSWDKKVSARVQFEKGDTTGWQRFDGDDFGEVVAQIDTFIKSL